MIAIVTDVRYRMSLALIRDLAQAGVEVITCEGERCRESAGSPSLGDKSRWTARHVWLPEEGRMDALLRLCRELGQQRACRPALLPVGAATLARLAAERERFDAVCGLCIPTCVQLEQMNSKERTARLAAGLGIPVPESFAPEEGESLEEFVQRLALPCVVKPVCGERLGLAAAERYRIARTREQAQAAWTHFSALAGAPPVVQTWLSGGGLGCSVLAREGEVIASICHRRVREYPVSGGPSSCCVCVDRPDLLDFVGRMTRETGYTGLAMFEFKEDGEGKPHLLEVNPRIWGTFPLTRTTGSGMALLWCILSWNAGNPDSPVPVPPAVRPGGGRMIFSASDLMAAVGYVRRGEPGRALQALGDLLNPFVRDGVFEWRDPRPGLAYFRSLLAKER